MYLRVSEDRCRNATPSAARRRQLARSHLEVRMFNVGRGEAILIVFPGRRAWLVEAGCNSPRRNETLGQRLLDYIDDRDLTLEAIVASHAHSDHAGAIAELLSWDSAATDGPVTIYRGNAEWGANRVWLGGFRDVFRYQGVEEEVVAPGTHQVVSISNGVEAHLFVGRGASVYTSLFLHLRFQDARLLFSGDAKCRYEIALLGQFGHDFRADVLKVTHHGSSSGTANTVLDAILPGIAIASTGDHPDHRLERDTRNRLRPRRRRIFETLVHGDIILKTDGRPFAGGLLYQVESESPGRFANGLGARTKSLRAVNRDRNRQRTRRHRECE